MKPFLYYSFLILMALGACAKIKKHKPEIIKVDGELQPVMSSINLPLVLRMDELEELVNQKLDGEIYSDKSFEKDDITVVITKVGRIQMSLSGNKLYYELPLNIEFEGHFQKKVIGVKLQKNQKLDFALTLRFCSEIGIDGQWNAIAHTKLLDLIWVKKPTVNLGIFKLSLSGLVESQLNKRLPDMLQKIDDSVKEKLKLKDIAQKVWNNIQKPILIHRRYTQVWLKALPKQFYMSNIHGKEGYIFINTRLDLQVFTTMGEPPPVNSADTIVAPLLTLTDTSSSFRLNVLTKLPLHDLNQALNKHVPKKDISYQDYHIKLKEFEMMGSDSQMLMRVDVGGDIHGDIYFKGRPVYDSIAQVLTLQNFDFDVSTEEILLGSADWLMHGTFKEKVEEEMRIPVGKTLDALPELIQNALANSKMGDKFSVEIQHWRMVPRQILVTYHDIQLLTHVEGHLKVKLEKIH